jgi:hypothetical protein
MRTWLALSLLSIGVLSQVSCGGGGGGGGGNVCDMLDDYDSSVSVALTFAADIQPILTPTNTCGLQLACHGTSGTSGPVAIDAAGMRHMDFTGDAAAARTGLLAMSINAPTMANVAPGDVGGSFMAYKLMGTAGLACVPSSCVAGASVGAKMPCGDPMPSTGGTLSAADRTKILDWIAQGAH